MAPPWRRKPLNKSVKKGFFRIAVEILLLVGFVVATRVFDVDTPPPGGSGATPRHPPPRAVIPAPKPSKRNVAREGGGPGGLWAAETRRWTKGSVTRISLPGGRARGRVPESIVIGKHGAKATGVSVGTAFALTRDGVWMTARHVVAGCDKVLIQVRARNNAGSKYLRADPVAIHPRADTAVLVIPKGGAAWSPVPLAAALARPGNAFHVGFPNGLPGAVHSVYLGTTRARRPGVQRGSERLVYWVEQSRIPSRPGSLGGMSGGAVFDQWGRVIGMTSAGNPRRGRILTSLPNTMWETIKQSGRRVASNRTGDSSRAVVNPENYPEFAKQLIRSNRVARVICLHGRKP